MAKKGFFRKYGSPRKPTPNRAPLRKIVDRVSKRVADGADGGGVYMTYEVLECGHEQLPVEDFAGATNATRRRCRKCEKEAAEKN
jgi:hypothetical protein